MTQRYKLQEIGKSIRRQIGRFGSEWVDEPEGAFLGDYSEQVVSPNGGFYYARLYNGKLIEAFNIANVEATFDKHVKVGRKKSRPDRWLIIEERGSYLPTEGYPGVGAHWHQHTVKGWDRVPVDIKQIVQYVIQVTDPENFIIAVNGRISPTSTGIKKVPTQFLDLSSYVITAGAKYIGVEMETDGTLSLNEGSVFASPAVGTDADFPVADTDKRTVGFVMLYESQATLSDDDVFIVTPIGIVTGTFGAAAWGLITGTLSDQTDLQDELDNKSDIDHTHDESGGAGGHVHGLARWNGASSQTTFDLPDIWEYVDSVMLNGLEEDPAVYSLSSDGTQIVLDTALSSSTLVIAHGVIAGV